MKRFILGAVLAASLVGLTGAAWAGEVTTTAAQRVTSPDGNVQLAGWRNRYYSRPRANYYPRYDNYRPSYRPYYGPYSGYRGYYRPYVARPYYYGGGYYYPYAGGVYVY